MNFNMENLWLCGNKSSPYYKKIAYLSMEIAVDQALKTYSGGLGYLSGSHMRSAFNLKQNIMGITILWTSGYYTQNRSHEGGMQADFYNHTYSFLKETDIRFTVNVHGHDVWVKVLLLKPKPFGTSPIFYLTTDIEENDPLSRSITNRLYDANDATRIAQSIILGVGGAKLCEILQADIEVYHMNEGHPLPLAFYLYAKTQNIEDVKRQLVFTTHTPKLAGNEERNIHLLEEMSFFSGVNPEEVKYIAKIKGETLNYTLTALRFCKKANAVSQLHSRVANKMWNGNEAICSIIGITNAQNKKYWSDDVLNEAFTEINDALIVQRKRELKKELFEIVADQTGKLFNPDILTVVWARRFAGYKRPALLLQDFERFLTLASGDNPIQVIWAGKPYPFDKQGIDLFNYIEAKTRNINSCAVLTGYELALSAKLKKGADIWLNTPRVTREASGTSGMSAAMNGAINFSTLDGWIPEFARHSINGFYIPVSDPETSNEAQDIADYGHMIQILEKEIVPMYYERQKDWISMMKEGVKDIIPAFDSDRMAKEYYEKLYS